MGAQAPTAGAAPDAAAEARSEAEKAHGTAHGRAMRTTTPVPALGFVGLGWIGRMRLDAVTGAGAARAAALCEPAEDRLADAAGTFTDAATFSSAEHLLDAADDLGLAGVVLATPNALHCRQAQAALDRGLAVFVQKPLGVTTGEVEGLLSAARAADRLVDVDYSYRHMDATREARRLVREGALGEVFLVEGVFHNAYGPDKAWCFDPAVSGGGAFLDLGVHLVDLSLHVLDAETVEEPSGWTRELPEHPGIDGFAVADYRIDGGTEARVVASWHAHAGRDCDFRLVLHGSDASAEIRNAGGSFYDFELVLRRGRGQEVVATDSRTWMDRGVAEWARRLGRDPSYDPGAERNVQIARLVDRLYGR